MWRNGRRNGLKIRWAIKGPCRFESGHRQLFDTDFWRVLAIYRSCGFWIDSRSPYRSAWPSTRRPPHTWCCGLRKASEFLTADSDCEKREQYIENRYIGKRFTRYELPI